MNTTRIDRHFADIKRKFQEELDDDADHRDLEEVLQEGQVFTAGESRFLAALLADDLLGFDYPSQAISAALRTDLDPEAPILDDFDPSAELLRAIARL